MSVDPADDCTFWYANEYLPANGSFNWKTRVGSFKFPSCSGSTGSVPTVVTGASSNVTSSGATVAGTVNPNGQSTTYQFDYGTTSSYGSHTTSTSAGSGTSAVNESANLTGLSPSTTYHYRIEATNNTGTSYGTDQTFTTPAAPIAPTVVTGASSNVTSSGATVAGTVNPNGQSTTYQFDYGTTSSYGSQHHLHERRLRNQQRERVRKPDRALAQHHLPLPDRSDQQHRHQLRHRPNVHHPRRPIAPTVTTALRATSPRAARRSRGR